MGEVTQSFELSLFENAFDMSMDYAELALDTIFENGVLKEIPIVKTIYSIGKMGFNIKDRHLLKEQLVFIQEFKDGRLSEERNKNIINAMWTIRNKQRRIGTSNGAIGWAY